MNPVRVHYIREKLLESTFEDQGEDARREMESRREVLTGMDVLDVGCGGGLLSEVRHYLVSLPNTMTHCPNLEPH